jgi:hypothetical protein
MNFIIFKDVYKCQDKCDLCNLVNDTIKCKSCKLRVFD